MSEIEARVESLRGMLSQARDRLKDAEEMKMEIERNRNAATGYTMENEAIRKRKRKYLSFVVFLPVSIIGIIIFALCSMHYCLENNINTGGMRVFELFDVCPSFFIVWLFGLVLDVGILLLVLFLVARTKINNREGLCIAFEKKAAENTKTLENNLDNLQNTVSLLLFEYIKLHEESEGVNIEIEKAISELNRDLGKIEELRR